MGKLATTLLTGYLSSTQVVSLVHYLMQAGNTSDAEAFVHELPRRVPQHGDALEGKLEGKLEVARTMLQNGIDRSTVIKITGLSEDDLAQIRY